MRDEAFTLGHRLQSRRILAALAALLTLLNILVQSNVSPKRTTGETIAGIPRGEFDTVVIDRI